MASQADIQKYFPVLSRNNNKSSASIFEARKNYYENTLSFITSSYILEDPSNNEFSGISQDEYEKKIKIPLSDVFTKNSLYGIFDLDGNIIAPVIADNNLISVGNREGNNIYLHNFVKDAYDDMRNYLNLQLVADRSLKNSIYWSSRITNALDKKATIEEYYFGFALLDSDIYKNYVLSNKQLDASITDARTFVQNYVSFLKSSLETKPVTKSRMMCYLGPKAFSTGLSFSISDDDPGNQENIYNKFLLDPGFFCFAKACLRFGFKIDINTPFLITADLSSPGMKPYLAKYSISDINDLFNKRYKKLYLEDLDSLKNLFFISYNNFLLDNEYYLEDYSKLCSNEANTVKYKIRKKVTEAEFSNLFPESYWIRLYCYFKFNELGSYITQQQFDNIVKQASFLVKYNKKEQALKYINNKMDETSGTFYFSSLQEKNTVLQLSSTTADSKAKDLIL